MLVVPGVRAIAYPCWLTDITRGLRDTQVPFDPARRSQQRLKMVGFDMVNSELEVELDYLHRAKHYRIAIG
jgi:hypothetical protein